MTTVETQAVTFARAMARTMATISDADALTMPDILPTWRSYLDAGTLADPIPWVSGMDRYEGKYYSYNGHIYRVATGGTMAPCVWEPGTTGLWQWELVG